MIKERRCVMGREERREIVVVISYASRPRLVKPLDTKPRECQPFEYRFPSRSPMDLLDFLPLLSTLPYGYRQRDVSCILANRSEQISDPRKRSKETITQDSTQDRSPLKHEHEWEIVDEKGLRGTKISE